MLHERDEVEDLACSGGVGLFGGLVVTSSMGTMAWALLSAAGVL